MSNISNRHSVVPFVAGKTVPLSNQRLAKVGYKSTKNQKAKFPNVAVSVPSLEGTEFTDVQMERMVPFIMNLLENAQDGIIRSLYESSNGALQSVSDEEISIDSCLAFMESESNGGRLTKEAIESWFDSELRDNLSITIAEKIGTDDLDSPVIGKHLNAYRELISSLAGGKTFLVPTQIKGCKVALELCKNEDEMFKKLMARLTKMESAPKIEELLEL